MVTGPSLPVGTSKASARPQGLIKQPARQGRTRTRRLSAVVKAAGRFILFCAWLLGMGLMSLTPTLITPPPPPAPPSSRDPNDHQILDTR